MKVMHGKCLNCGADIAYVQNSGIGHVTCLQCGEDMYWDELSLFHKVLWVFVGMALFALFMSVISMF